MMKRLQGGHWPLCLLHQTPHHPLEEGEDLTLSKESIAFKNNDHFFLFYEVFFPWSKPQSRSWWLYVLLVSRMTQPENDEEAATRRSLASMPLHQPTPIFSSLRFFWLSIHDPVSGHGGSNMFMLECIPKTLYVQSMGWARYARPSSTHIHFLCICLEIQLFIHSNDE